MKKIINILIFIYILINFTNADTSIITTLNKNDPQPIFSTAFPYNYLSQNEKEFFKNRTDVFEPQSFSLSITPFTQHAKTGKNINKRRSELGNLTGNWNLLAALPFNGASAEDIPAGKEPIPTLVMLRENLIQCIADTFSTCKGGQTVTAACFPDEFKTVQGLISLQRPEQLFGFFSVAIKYRKTGVRFNADIRLFHDFGFSIQTGVADIYQLARFVDQTISPTTCQRPPGCTDPVDDPAEPGISCTSNPPPNTPAPGVCTACGLKSCHCAPVINPSLTCENPFTDNRVNRKTWNFVSDCVHTELMNKYWLAARSMGLNLCNFHKSSVEDVHFEFWWRRSYNISRDCTYRQDFANSCWSPFLFTPFFAFGASIGTGAKIDPDRPLSVPFGNNGHNAFRFNGGYTLDFYNTIEIGMHAGVTHFFKKRFNNYRVPTNGAQNEFIPYTTNVSIEPGDTWHIGLVMNAYHFLDCFSSWAEYIFVTHTKDTIKLCKPDNAFRPGVLECKSPWSVQLFNVTLNYDISPNFTIGAAVQLPIGRTNAYKSTTYLGSLIITY